MSGDYLQGYTDGLEDVRTGKPESAVASGFGRGCAWADWWTGYRHGYADGRDWEMVGACKPVEECRE